MFLLVTAINGSDEIFLLPSLDIMLMLYEVPAASKVIEHVIFVTFVQLLIVLLELVYITSQDTYNKAKLRPGNFQSPKCFVSQSLI